jgi:hypothetical protein
MASLPRVVCSLRDVTTGFDIRSGELLRRTETIWKFKLPKSPAGKDINNDFLLILASRASLIPGISLVTYAVDKKKVPYALPAVLERQKNFI